MNQARLRDISLRDNVDIYFRSELGLFLTVFTTLLIFVCLQDLCFAFLLVLGIQNGSRICQNLPFKKKNCNQTHYRSRALKGYDANVFFMLWLL